MTTLTEMVAAVVVHSSAAAFSHFGVTLDVPPEPAPHTAVAPAEQRVVARSRNHAVKLGPFERASTCPDAPHARVVKA
ncbi:MAG: hypothetical protein JF588_03180 [Caulobacterales bacterium]|nr:hypothetical protein [Caulobacterales bacterium]